MTCRQVSTYNGVPASSGSYATEADCNQACKEGACCEGTTCSVKPACQCQCTTGSCCGPDTFTNANGETGPRCRTENKSQCDARGGTFRCGVGCIRNSDENTGPPPAGIDICTSLASSPSSPVFKGVGTTCSPSPCGCCCISGNAGATTNEQQCTAAGGTWKSYSCNSPAPTSILLTLSLNNYSAYVSRSPTSTAPGVFEFDFSCIKTSYTLRYVSSPYSWMAFSAEANAFLLVSTSGSFGPGGTSTTCGCQTPLFLGGGMNIREETMSRRAGSTAAMNCAAGAIVAGYTWGLTFYYPGNAFNTVQDPVSVPGFCTGQYGVTGTVYGPGEVQCGTFTLGNPLP